PRTDRRYPAIFDGQGDLGQNFLRRIPRARRGFTCRHGIGLLLPAHDLDAAVAVRVNLQDRGFGLAQSALLGMHYGVPVVIAHAKIGTIGCGAPAPLGNDYGVAMPVRSCSRKAEGEQTRQRNQKKEVASRHGVLPASIDDTGCDWSRAIPLLPTASLGALTPVLSIFLPTPPSKPLRVNLLQTIGGKGQQITDISFSSDLPSSAEDSSYQKLAAQKSVFVILKLKGDLPTRDQTSHLHRSIPEHRAAHMGFH